MMTPTTKQDALQKSRAEEAQAAAVAEIADTTADPAEAMMAVAAMSPDALAEQSMAKDALDKPGAPVAIGGKTIATSPAMMSRAVEATKMAGLPPAIWISGLIVLMALLLWVFTRRI